MLNKFVSKKNAQSLNIFAGFKRTYLYS